jgi:hypothetical protein
MGGLPLRNSHIRLLAELGCAETAWHLRRLIEVFVKFAISARPEPQNLVGGCIFSLCQPVPRSDFA